MKKAIVAVSVIAAVGGILTLIHVRRAETIQVQAKTDKQLVEDVGEYQDQVITMLRQASVEYPVPYVREQLVEILRGVDNKSVVIANVFAADPAYDGLHARFRRTEDGRPMIQFFFKSNARFVMDLADRLGTDESGVLDPLLMDWFVFVTVHEWTHYKLGHRYDAGVDLATHMRQESEAWADGFAKVVAPAIQRGRFSFPLSNEIVYGFVCFKAAHGCVTHPAWQAFVRAITTNSADAWDNVERIADETLHSGR